MSKNELIASFVRNHNDFVNYVLSLPEGQLNAGTNGKWAPAQQLSHIYLTILPFTRVLASKEFIADKFGKIERATWDYDTVIANYLKTTRKAPDAYDPTMNAMESVPTLKEKIDTALLTIQAHLSNFTEQEMDTLVIPHPLLGKLTIREMFYLMSYHPVHHLRRMDAS